MQTSTAAVQAQQTIRRRMPTCAPTAPVCPCLCYQPAAQTLYLRLIVQACTPALILNSVASSNLHVKSLSACTCFIGPTSHVNTLVKHAATRHTSARCHMQVHASNNTRTETHPYNHVHHTHDPRHRSTSFCSRLSSWLSSHAWAPWFSASPGLLPSPPSCSPCEPL